MKFFHLPSSFRRCLFVTACALFASTGFAQIEPTLARYDYRIDSTETRQLRLDINSLSFFKDNEFEGNVMKGYTLPGLWVAPKVTYQPLSNLRFEAGVNLLMYHGAYRYPNYAYQDIEKWKGEQYQHGAHVLPIFRGQLQLKNVNLVLGHLYGGETHQLPIALYNPELNLTADPEMGFQILLDHRRFHFDAWIDWESFIFDESTHQESFIVGLSTRYRFNDPESKYHFYAQLQGLAQHRGGEQDTACSVQTLMNGGIGAGMRWNTRNKVLQWLNFEANLLGYYQQAGTLWPYNGGSAQMLSAEALFKYNLHLRADYLRSNRFISLLGSPFFGSVSTKEEGARFSDHPQTLHLALDYSLPLGKRYAFGAKVETYYCMPGDMTLADGSVAASSNSFNTSFGVYLRINPNFLLKSFK